MGSVFSRNSLTKYEDNQAMQPFTAKSLHFNMALPRIYLQLALQALRISILLNPLSNILPITDQPGVLCLYRF